MALAKDSPFQIFGNYQIALILLKTDPTAFQPKKGSILKLNNN